MTTAWVIHKRRGERCQCCVISPWINSHVSRVLLAFCSRAPAFCRLKAHGIPFAAQCGTTFLPFYSTKMENLSENRSEVAPPQREMRILIENGNEVARPPCHLQIFIQKGNAVAQPPSQILQVWRIIKKGRWWQWEFLVYFNRTMGNSCKIMNKITNNLHLHQNLI